MSERKSIPQAYEGLQERLDKGPEGAPKADELFEILRILFTEEEAFVGSRMPMLPAGVEAIAQKTGMEPEPLSRVLASMADKGLLVDLVGRKKTKYVLAPPVIGFLEYAFMKRNEHLPMKRLAELAETYLKDHLLPKELAAAQTQRTRTLPYEDALGEMHSEVVPYERARELILSSTRAQGFRAPGGGALGVCFCRREAGLRGHGCKAPVEDICMGLGRGGDYLVRHGFARPATVDELLAKLDQAEGLGLVHTTDNVQEKGTFMCHCCGCCCHLLRSINELNLPGAVAPSSLAAQVDAEACTACGLCEKRCQVNAVLVDETAVVHPERCLGCGVCVTTCPAEAIMLVKRENAPVPPKNIMELFSRLVYEKGRTQHYM